MTEIERLVTDGGVTVDSPTADLTLGDADPTIDTLGDVYLDGTLVLVGCGAAKRDPSDPTDLHLAAVEPGEEWGGREGPMWRAEDLYTSTYFAVKREFADVVSAWARSSDAASWSVLSAEHGVVANTRPLAPYDTTIDDLGDDPTNPDHRVSGAVRRRPDGEEIVTELDQWVTTVAYGLERWLAQYRDGTGPEGEQRASTLLILAGQDYVEPLRERGVFKYGISRMSGQDPNAGLRSLDVETRSLFEEIDADGIGEQMGWLSDSVDRLEPLVNDAAESEQDTLERETVAGVERSESGE